MQAFMCACLKGCEPCCSTEGAAAARKRFQPANIKDFLCHMHTKDGEGTKRALRREQGALDDYRNVTRDAGVKCTQFHRTHVEAMKVFKSAEAADSRQHCVEGRFTCRRGLQLGSSMSQQDREHTHTPIHT